MTEPKPPSDALDEQEREFARILRALPGGDPPAALDQAILRSAANAAAASRRPRARWLASGGALWGIGTAAAAVLALGVSWQMIDPTRPDSAPRRQAAPVGLGSDEGAVTVDLGELKDSRADAPAAAADAPAPLPAPRMVERERSLATPAAVAPVPAPPPPAPVAFAEDQASGTGAVQGQAAAAAEPSVNAIDIASVESDTVLTSEQISTLQDRAEADASAGNAAKARAAESAGAMTPAAWLARVRKLRAEGQVEQARSSLVLFHRYYPQYVIPADLAPLLRE